MVQSPVLSSFASHLNRFHFGCLITKERQRYWDEQNAFYITDETEEEEGKVAAETEGGTS